MTQNEYNSMGHTSHERLLGFGTFCLSQVTRASTNTETTTLWTVSLMETRERVFWCSTCPYFQAYCEQPKTFKNTVDSEDTWSTSSHLSWYSSSKIRAHDNVQILPDVFFFFFFFQIQATMRGREFPTKPRHRWKSWRKHLHN